MHSSDREVAAAGTQSMANVGERSAEGTGCVRCNGQPLIGVVNLYGASVLGSNYRKAKASRVSRDWRASRGRGWMQ
jgi:hypothetical protein